MDEIILKKGMRLRKPTTIRVDLRAVVYEWLCNSSNELACGVNVLVRGIIEDYYDKCNSPAPAAGDDKPDCPE